METGASKVFNFEGEGTKSPRCKRVNSPPPPLKFIQEGLKPTLLVCYVPNYTSFFLTLREFFLGWGGISIKKFRVHTHLDLLV